MAGLLLFSPVLVQLLPIQLLDILAFLVRMLPASGMSKGEASLSLLSDGPASVEAMLSRVFHSPPCLIRLAGIIVIAHFMPWAPLGSTEESRKCREIRQE